MIEVAAYIHARSAAMLCELEAMRAANAERARLGHAPAYDEAAFMALPRVYGLTLEHLIATLRDTGADWIAGRGGT